MKAPQTHLKAICAANTNIGTPITATDVDNDKLT